jgi:hypothetical protein
MLRETIAGIEEGKMYSRRMTGWWFRFVLSGRFLDKFLCMP